jgi:hypothetical protein
LNRWIDREIASARSEFRENGARDLVTEAFQANAYHRGLTSSSPEMELRARLDAKADAITEVFAEILHERNVRL